MKRGGIMIAQTDHFVASTRQPGRVSCKGRARGTPPMPVISHVRLFDLVTGDLTETDIAICGDTVVRPPMAGSRARHCFDAQGADRRGPASIDTASACRNLPRLGDRRSNSTAACSARGHHGDLRSARDGQCAGDRCLRFTSSPAPIAPSWICGCSFRVASSAT